MRSILRCGLVYALLVSCALAVATTSLASMHDEMMGDKHAMMGDKHAMMGDKHAMKGDEHAATTDEHAAMTDEHAMKGKSLYDRLGGTYAIATVVDDFIERILVNETLNANPAIAAARSHVPKAGLKFQVAALVVAVTGGPYPYHGRDMYDAHKHLNITEKEWAALAKDFKASLDHFSVPAKEQEELFAIVASTKDDIVLPGNENKALLRRFYEETLNAKNVAVLEKFLASNIVDHAAMPGQVPGLEGARQMFSMLYSAFPDLHVTVGDIIAEGDRVAARIVLRATHKGEFMGIPATGKTVEVTGTEIMRIANAKMVEHWENFDMLGMMRQLGVAPSPQGATDAMAMMAHDHDEAMSVSTTSKPPMPEEARSLGRAYMDAMNSGVFTPIEKAVSPHHVEHDPMLPPDMRQGGENVKKSAMMYRSAFPDAQMIVEAQIVERDRVVTRWTATGTHKGELMGIAPTGKPVKVTGISINRIADGKIVESWTNWDGLGMMMQLGVVPMPGSTGEPMK